nr:serine carboxypeptidase-like 18 isoform X2 [Solanum lycopersicum]
MSSNNLLLLLLHLLLLQQEVTSHSLVEYLPGLQGRLPFHLETGYVGIGKDNELQHFYYFLASESEPTTNPLLIWLTGGPGCSSLSAIVNEIGPLRFAELYNGSLPTFELNPHALTKIASVIFLDQPVNTGFSYATNDAAYKYTDIQACEYVDEFLRKWLDDHPQFISNPFYVAGNSYSGMTIPVITQLISNRNAEGKEPLINLQGYLLGNPLTFSQEKNYHIPFSHGMGLISDELYKSLEKNCKGEYTYMDPKNTRCASEVRTFNQMISNINTKRILRPNCEEDPRKRSGQRRLLGHKLISLQRGDPCAFDWRKLVKYWANDPKVQEALHVRKGIIGSWMRCRRNISMSSAWIKSLNYTIDDDWRPWNVNNQVSGYTRSYSNKMTYATVKGAGHTACTDKPEECFVMFKRWISDDPL